MSIKKQLSVISSAAILSMGLATGLVLNFSQATLAFEPQDVCQHNNDGYGDFIGQTENYSVTICSSKGSRAYYFGKPRNGDDGIALRGRSINNGQQYVFRNGQYTYVVSQTFLTVTKNGRVIVKERFLNGGLLPNE